MEFALTTFVFALQMSHAYFIVKIEVNITIIKLFELFLVYSFANKK
jgi:hypothetical protein